MTEAAQVNAEQGNGAGATAAAAAAANAAQQQDGNNAGQTAQNGANGNAANGATNGANGTNAQANGAQGTLVNGGQASQQQQNEKPYWPDDWRERIAEHASAGDKKAYDKELKRLQNMDSPNAVYGSWRNMESTWASRKFVKLPGEDAKPEDLAEFHKALGVPEKPEDYFKSVKLENGAVIGDADKPIVDGFANAVHKAGATPAVVSAALNWYFGHQEQQAVKLDEMDDSYRREATQALQNDYGNGFKRKINSIAPLFASAPGGPDVSNPKSLYARLMGGRTADGRIIGDDPDMVRWLASISQEVNPAASIVEDAGGGGQTVDARIAEIEKVMRTDRREYNKNTAMQTEYGQLLSARETIRARAR
jgi:hypothetical protein